MLTLPNFAASSALVDAVANDIKHYKVLTVSNHKTIWVPDNYTKIQDAINNANDGDTIVVSSGTYPEHIDLYKSVNLLGKDALTTVIDGQGSGTVIKVATSNVIIDSFTIKSGKVGIYLLSARNCLIRKNIVKNNKDGISSASSRNCTIIENNVGNNSDRGINLEGSLNCSVENNIVEKNDGYGLNLHVSQNCSIVGNTVRGGDKDYDAIGLLSCADCLVVGNTANDSQGIGVWVESSTNCVVDENYVSNNRYGIKIITSYQCKIEQNDIRNSQVLNLGLYSSSMNTFYHNNFIATNVSQVESINSVNVMHNDTLKEGNYWSDYNGTDHDNDGIGDTAYVIDNDERDNYPLIAGFASFSISHGNRTHNVEMISNSTISNFEFNATKNEIRFKVSGEGSTHGFCRIGIPKALMNGNLVVRVDGSAVAQKKLEHPNLASNYLYFTYVHSMHQVTITLEPSQELSLLQLLLLTALVALIAASILILMVKRKRLHTPMRPKKRTTFKKSNLCSCCSFLSWRRCFFAPNPNRGRCDYNTFFT